MLDFIETSLFGLIAAMMTVMNCRLILSDYIIA
jgi:hypothetical protein